MGFEPPRSLPPPGKFTGVSLFRPPGPPPSNLGLSFSGVFEPPIQLQPHEFDIGVNAGFSLALPGVQFCGLSLALPGIAVGFSFNPPLRFPPFPFPPSIFFFISLMCNLSHPFVSLGYGFGGGRNTRADPDADPDYFADL